MDEISHKRSHPNRYCLHTILTQKKNLLHGFRITNSSLGRKRPLRLVRQSHKIMAKAAIQSICNPKPDVITIEPEGQRAALQRELQCNRI